MSSSSNNANMAGDEKAFKEKMIRNVKKEVKQIMEEAVTKKFVNEESSSITSLCAAVEVCILHGLKRRALGLFKSNSTTALLHKVAKTFEPAAHIVQLMTKAESTPGEGNKRSSSAGSESTSRLGLLGSSGTLTSGKSPVQTRNSYGTLTSSSSVSTPATMKYLWIRLALIEKELASIIDYIVENSSKFYERDALVCDPDYGSILSSLLVGPCALDFSKLRAADHFWTDPPADELVQRHRISSFNFSTPQSPPVVSKRPLHFKGGAGSVSVVGSGVFTNPDENLKSKDYVESLHQNSRSTLLYGKNNVLVYMKDRNEPLAGYMSLHQYGQVLNLKWTPNQLMNGCSNESSTMSSTSNSPTHLPPLEKNVLWTHALNLKVHEIVYVHCHQGPESDWIVLVGQDGVQRPPIHFPRGGHLLAFLSCLENGLLPHGMLDPPLWSQRGTGKVFPKLRRKGSRLKKGEVEKESDNGTGSDEDNKENNSGDMVSSLDTNNCDFVFRIVYPNLMRTCPVEEMLEDPWGKTPSTPKSAVMPCTPRSTPLHSMSTTSSTSSSRSLDQQQSSATLQETGEPIQVFCQTMTRQIISRAFYGWLAHCRHLRTVRTHLVGLVRHSEIVSVNSPVDASGGLTEQKWADMQQTEVDLKELHRLVYFGGMAASLRKTVWPVMLSGRVEQEDKLKLRRDYEHLMSEWLAVEAIVRQRDKEIMAANVAKLSSEGGSSQSHSGFPTSPHLLQTHESNEVFEEVSSVSSAHAPVICSSEKQEEQCAVTAVTKNKKAEGDEEADNELSSLSSNDSRVSSCVDGGENGGGVYSSELLETFGLNLHRIDKDVKRCDRNYWYFNEKNLDKLRNVMCTYVWENMEMGYVQGMCDLAAPLLVILDDEAQAYNCFRHLMSRMSANFPSGGGAMDGYFANMRSLLQVLDHDLFALIRQNGDYTHFYFCYRWFLLDFKREFCYDDVFLVWETIWAARHVASTEFGLFLALALLNYYRDIILANSMDFTDIIKFFNEMAERHDAKVILQIARSLVLQLQTLIEDK